MEPRVASSFRDRSRCFAKRFVVACLIASAFAIAFCAPRTAHAYPWMIRHEYTACAPCHADPSGAGILTKYGRAQSEILLRTRYGGTAEDDPGTLGDFAFGALPLPDWFDLQADVRAMALRVKPPSPAPVVAREILMQADAAAAVNAGPFRAAGTLGYVHEGALGASVTRGTEDRLVSRQHWAGVTFGTDDAFLARAGRMNLPFGLRTIEHTSFVRSGTRTDINAAQSHGIAVAYNADGWRGELMAIAGNFQLRPASLHERGLSGYVERALTQKLAVGASSLVVHAEYDLSERTSAFRQAHALFARWSPSEPFVFYGEADLLVSSAKRRTIMTGTAALAGVDIEPLRGLHVDARYELIVSKLTRDEPQNRFGAAAFWFFAPHADVRVDGWFTKTGAGDVWTAAAQLHFFL